MRPDGTRVKEASTIVSALPYVMPRRYDAQNFITEYADMEVLRRYIQEKRREGVRIPYMTLILAAYFKAYQENPKINRFIMNRRIYQRNHFCVSFVILKNRADGTPDETSVKIFFEDGDDVFSISCGGDPAIAYDRLMRRTLLMQRMEQVLTPRELNLVRSYLGIGQPDEVGMTFQELAIYLNYNGPSGAEKAYKAALRKLKKDLYTGAYGRWLFAQKVIRAAIAEAEMDAGYYTTPQRTGV